MKSIDDFIEDTRLFNYAMKAFGLEDMAYAKAFMRKVLTEGVSDPQSFANRLADDRFVEFAKTFNFADTGEDTTTTTDAQQGVVDRYVRQTLETQAGEDNEGVRLALYFQREAPNVKSVYGLLADAALWTGGEDRSSAFPTRWPTPTSSSRRRRSSQRLDIADLQDPAKLDRLITRFAAAWDATRERDVRPDPGAVRRHRRRADDRPRPAHDPRSR